MNKGNLKNPFHYLGPCSPNIFVGRSHIINNILVGSQNGFAIAAGRRIGKSSLLMKINTITRSGKDFFPLYIDCSNFSTYHDLISEISRRLYPQYSYKMRDRYQMDLSRMLTRFRAMRKIPRLLLLLDEMDPLVKSAQNSNEDTITFFNFLREPLNRSDVRLVITGVRHVFEMINDLNNPLCNICEGVNLGMLSRDEVNQLISIPLEKTGIDLDPPDDILDQIFNITSGHPSLVQFIGKKIFENRINNKITLEIFNDVISHEDLIDFVLDNFILNTDTLERLICLLTTQMNYFEVKDLLSIFETNSIEINNTDEAIYLALKNLTINSILKKHENRYEFLNPLMRKIISDQYYSPKIIDLLTKNLKQNEFRFFSSKELKEKIISRSIEFPPDYQQAGLSILNYFGNIVKQKYPDANVGITIKQQGLKVTMIVETPEGEKHTIEKALDDYGLVICGKMSPEALLSEPNHVLALKHKLEMAYMEIRHTNELMYMERSQFEKRVKELESEVGRLYNIVGDGLQSNQSLIKIIGNSMKANSSSVRDALKILEVKILQGIKESDEIEVKKALETLQKDNPGLFKQIFDLIVKGSISGAAGNFLYEWINAISWTLPK